MARRLAATMTNERESQRRAVRASGLGAWLAAGVLALAGWGVYAKFIKKPPAPEVITAEVERTHGYYKRSLASGQGVSWIFF